MGGSPINVGIRVDDYSPAESSQKPRHGSHPFEFRNPLKAPRNWVQGRTLNTEESFSSEYR
jgi:hypothetical protein